MSHFVAFLSTALGQLLHTAYILIMFEQVLSRLQHNPNEDGKSQHLPK